MRLDESARRLGRLLNETPVDAPTVSRQGTVTAIDAGPPRTIEVSLSDVSGVEPIKNVALLTHHSMPSVSDVVWIERVGRGRWLFKGEQG